MSSTPPTLPSRARVVVIGGGVIGTSVAYHLGHLGLTDTVLVERDQLTSGTTWHAAGLMITFGSTSSTSTALRCYTRDLYTRLEAETGLATGFKPVGFIELAGDEGRLEEYRRVATFNRYCGIDVHEISPREVADLFPLARTDDLLAGFWVPGDGRVNPVDLTMSLAKGARMGGVRVMEGVSVLDIVTGVTAVTPADRPTRRNRCCRSDRFRGSVGAPGSPFEKGIDALHARALLYARARFLLEPRKESRPC